MTATGIVEFVLAWIQDRVGKFLKTNFHAILCMRLMSNRSWGAPTRSSQYDSCRRTNCRGPNDARTTHRPGQTPTTLHSSPVSSGESSGEHSSFVEVVLACIPLSNLPFGCYAGAFRVLFGCCTRPILHFGCYARPINGMVRETEVRDRVISVLGNIPVPITIKRHVPCSAQSCGGHSQVVCGAGVRDGDILGGQRGSRDRDASC